MKNKSEYISIPKKEYDRLHRMLEEYKEFAEKLLGDTINLAERIEQLEKENKELRATIKKFKGEQVPRKNSSNSNLPPSKDLYRVDRRRSLRKKSNKKSGGQLGHKGHHLGFSPDPDERISLMPIRCEGCGKVLDHSMGRALESRQVIDLPMCKPVTYEYTTYEVKCDCGVLSRSVFPENVRSKTQYGNRVRSLINYLSVRQYIPFGRLVETLRDCFGLKLSEGTIANTLKRTSSKASELYEKIKLALENSNWLGSDETTIYVKGQKNTMWVWQNAKYTWLCNAASRHGKHIEKLFPKGFKKAILSSDQYAAQISTPSKGHQLCWVHILRKIAYLEECSDHYWLKELKRLFKKANRLKKIKKRYSKRNKLAKSVELKLNQLLLRKLNKRTHPEILKLQRSLCKNRDYLLTFLYHEEVPPDNNSSEKAIRNAKVKMKISGGFKSLQQVYNVIRSVIDTSIKNSRNVLEVLTDIENGEVVSF